MTTRSSNFSNLLAPGLRKIFFDEWKGLATEYDKIANVETIDRAYVTDYQLTALGGTFPEKGEGVSIDFVDPKTGTTKTYTAKSFGLGFRVTEEAYDDELYAIIKKMPKGLAKAARNTKELKWASLFDDAFAGSNFTGFDGHPLCYTAHHILYTGGTQGNTPGTQVDLGIASLQAAILAIESQVDEDNVYAGLKAKRLLISPANRFIAKELLQSEYKPFSANNEVNSLKGEGIDFFVGHYFSDTDAWWLIADQHDLNFFQRKPLVFANSDDFVTGDALFKATERYVWGFGDYRGVYGSSGG